jgi:hypothetical protein
MNLIKLQIREPFYEDYLRLIFKCPSGNITIKATPEIGKFIHSQIKISDTPRQSAGKDHINLLVPLSHTNKENSFIYFDHLATDQINKFIASSFNIHFRQFCQAGRERGIKYNFIINAFIALMKINYSTDIYERLKKKDYRNRREITSFLTEGLKLIENDMQPIEY